MGECGYCHELFYKHIEICPMVWFANSRDITGGKCGIGSSEAIVPKVDDVKEIIK